MAFGEFRRHLRKVNGHVVVTVVLDAVEIKFQSFSQQVVYFHGTTVASSFMVTMKISCPSDVSQFPYDKQTCPIIMDSWILGNTVFLIGEHLSIKKAPQSPFELFFSQSHYMSLLCCQSTLSMTDGTYSAQWRLRDMVTEYSWNSTSPDFRDFTKKS